MSWSDQTYENPDGPYICVGGELDGQIQKNPPGRLYELTSMRTRRDGPLVHYYCYKPLLIELIEDASEARKRYRLAVSKSRLLK